MLRSVKDIWKKIDSWYFRQGNPYGKNDFSFFQKHHFFWGIIIWLIAFFLEMTTSLSDWLLNCIMMLGVWIGYDDYFQHQRQRRELKRHGVYRTKSFWHWVIYDYIFPFCRVVSKSVCRLLG